MFSKVDVSNIIGDILPGVELIGNMAKVRCCYWNEWEGLVRETVYINFNDRKKFVLIKNLNQKSCTNIIAVYAFGCYCCCRGEKK